MSSPARESGCEALPRNVRAVMRIDDEFLVRKMDAVAGDLMGGEFLRALIWNTIWTLNIQHVTRNKTAIRYAALHAFPPDEERRPISVHSLAQMLRLPAETVRRQVLTLERDDLCRRIPGKGVLVPTAVMMRPQIIEATRLVIAAVQRFVADLARAGFPFAPAAKARSAATDMQSIARAVIRIDTQYTLDVVDMLRPLHNDDPMEAMVFLAISMENTRQIGDADYDAIDTIVPDALRRPVSVLAASSSMMIPYETLRRTVNRMTRAGRLARVKDGVIVPAAVQRRLEDKVFLRRRYARMQTLVADLQYIGMMPPR